MPYKCDNCDKNYKSYQSLWNHNKKFHTNKNNKDIKIISNDIKIISKNNIKLLENECQYCNKKLSDRHSKWRHEKTCKRKKHKIVADIAIKNKVIKLTNKLNELKKNIQSPQIEYKYIDNKLNEQLINMINDKNKIIDELKNQTSNKIFDKKTVINKSQLNINNININLCIENNYINALELCKSGNKELHDWLHLHPTKVLIDNLSIKVFQNNNSNFLIYINEDNNDEVWMHPKLAIELAKWLSPKIASEISDWLLDSLNNKLEEKYKENNLQQQQIKILQDLYVKKQKRHEYPEKNVIYILTTEENKDKRIYIIGKAKELKNRLSTYNKTSEHIVEYYKECKSEESMNTVEMMVLIKLEEYREKANRDRFILPIDKDISFFTNIIDNAINFF